MLRYEQKVINLKMRAGYKKYNDYNKIYCLDGKT